MRRNKTRKTIVIGNDKHEQIMHELGSLKGSTEQGFKGVHERLDKLNGSVARHEEELTQLKIVDAKNEGGKSISNKLWGIGGTILGAVVIFLITNFLNK